MSKHCVNCGKALRTDSELCAACKHYAHRADNKRAEKLAAEKVAQAEHRAERTVEAAAEVAHRKLRFLTELLQNGGHVEHACKAAGVSRVMMGRYRDDDAEFATAWETVQESNIERLETEADRRALGYDEPVFYKGEPTGHSVTRFSDNLLMFRLKALRPEKYRDGPGASKTATQLSEDELNDALQKMIRRRAGNLTVDLVAEQVS